MIDTVGKANVDDPVTRVLFNRLLQITPGCELEDTEELLYSMYFLFCITFSSHHPGLLLFMLSFSLMVLFQPDWEAVLWLYQPKKHRFFFFLFFQSFFPFSGYLKLFVQIKSSAPLLFGTVYEPVLMKL